MPDTPNPTATTAAASSGAAASTATPTTTTATPTAPVTTTTGTPDAGAGTGEGAAVDAGKSTQQLILDKLNASQELDALVPGFEKKDPAAADPAAKTDADPDAAIADDAAAAATDETVDAEAAAAAEAAETAEEDVDEEPFSLDAPGVVAPKELAGIVNDNPEFKAVLDANPEIKNKLFATARQAARAAQYEEVFPTPAEAAIAAEGHQALVGVQELMGGVVPGDVKTTLGVVDKMVEMSALRDETGAILKNPDGSVKSDGTVGRFVKELVGFHLSRLEAAAEKDGDFETQEVLGRLMEREGLRAPSSANQEDVDEATKAREASVTAREDALKASEQSAYAERVQQFENSIAGQIDTGVDTSINQLLSKATLSPFEKEQAVKAIRNEVFTKVAANPRFKEKLMRLQSLAPGKDAEAKRVALGLEYSKPLMRKVAGEVLAKIGVDKLERQDEKTEKQAAREDAARSESKSAIRTAKPLQAPTTQDFMTQAETELIAEMKGNKPTSAQVIARVMELRSKQKVA